MSTYLNIRLETDGHLGLYHMHPLMPTNKGLLYKKTKQRKSYFMQNIAQEAAAKKYASQYLLFEVQDIVIPRLRHFTI